MTNHPYAFGDKIVIDGNTDIPWIVVSFEYRKDETYVLGCLWDNSKPTYEMFPIWRTSKFVDPRNS